MTLVISFVISESRKRKSFCAPIVYSSSNEKASGVMTLTEYNKFDVCQQKVEELSQLGLDPDEVELKMVDSGLVQQVVFGVCKLFSWEVLEWRKWVEVIQLLFEGLIETSHKSCKNVRVRLITIFQSCQILSCYAIYLCYSKKYQQNKLKWSMNVCQALTSEKQFLSPRRGSNT